jgi:hypothetical protein
MCVHACIVILVACCRAGIIALVVMASLPFDALASLPLLQWHFLISHCCHHQCVGISAVVEFASSPLLLVVKLA